MAIEANINAIKGDVLALGGQAGPKFKKVSATEIAVVDNAEVNDISVRVAQVPTLHGAISRRVLADTFVKIVEQADCSVAIPANTSTIRFLVVTTPGSGAVIGDILYDDGSNSGIMQIIPKIDGRFIVVTKTLSGGLVSLADNAHYVWDALTQTWAISSSDPIEIQDNDVTVQTPMVLLNFEKPLKAVADGANKATISVFESHILVGGVENVIGTGTELASYGGIVDATCGITAIKNGEIYGISVTSTTARTAGTCQVQSVINGVANNGAGQFAELNGTNTTKAFQVLTTPIPFNAGDVLQLQIVSSGFTPTAADLVVSLFFRDR